MIKCKQLEVSWMGPVLVAVLLSSTVSAAPVPPQDPVDHKSHAEHVAKQEPSLAEQLADLKAKVAKLEAALHQNHQGRSQQPAQTGAAAGGMAMGGNQQGMGGMGMGGMMKGMGGMGMGTGGMMKGMGGMGGMNMNATGSVSGMQASPDGSSMSMGAMGGMGMGQMKRMRMMGSMGRAQTPGRSAVLSALPGFPGASHIYHIGASSHFLEYADALGLSRDQHKQLSELHERSELQQNDLERALEQLEQELWVLTSEGEPDVAAVSGKVREIATKNAEMRLEFIRSVGEAAKALTDAQRKALVGEYEAGASSDSK